MPTEGFTVCNLVYFRQSFEKNSCPFSVASYTCQAEGWGKQGLLC